MNLKKIFISASIVFLTCLVFAQDVEKCTEGNCINGYGTYVYDDGTYTGEWKNGLYHGEGAYLWSDGDKYTGQWANDQKNGYGTYLWNSGAKYEGLWVNNNPHGFGKYFYANGDRYEGFWENDNQNGFGKFFYANGDRYEGVWENDKKHGYGIYFYANGDRYEGNWYADEKYGQGRFYQNGKLIYDGNFRDNISEGEGTLYYSENSIEFKSDYYKGEIKDYLRNGKGILVYQNGQSIEGSFMNDVFLGKFELSHKYNFDSLNYAGTVTEIDLNASQCTIIMNLKNTDIEKYLLYTQIDDKIITLKVLSRSNIKLKCMIFNPENTDLNKLTTGHKIECFHEEQKCIKFSDNTFMLSSGIIYRGKTRNNLMHGQGFIIFPNLDNFNGIFENGYYKQGKYISHKGFFIEGDWKNNMLEGKGREGADPALFQKTDEIQHVYTGEFKSGLHEGKGEIIWNNGDRYIGSFKKNLRYGNGIYYHKSGNIYMGNFESNKRNGHGKMFFNSGGMYVGNWLNGEENGKGTLKWISNDQDIQKFSIFKQILENIIMMFSMVFPDSTVNKFNFTGQLLTRWLTGHIYSGDFRDGLKIGFGTYKYEDGTVYTGTWKDDKMEGYGKAEFSNGDTYTGNFSDYRMDGKGTYTFSNGDVYTGNFRNDKFSGKGKMTYKSGKTESGIWKEGELGE